MAAGIEVARSLGQAGSVPPAVAYGLTTVFVDRDGTINAKAADGDYVKSWSEFRFLPGAKEAIALLLDYGLRVIVVTNQRGVGLGRMSDRDLEEIHSRMVVELEAAGAWPVAVYHCPHDLGLCDCRKPDPGLLLRAQRDDSGIEFEHSVVVGDAESDMTAAAHVGARRILVAPPPGSQPRLEVDHVATSLLDAALWLTGADRRPADNS